MGNRITVAKLTRVQLPKGAYSCLMDGGSMIEVGVTDENGLVVFCLEGQSEHTTHPLSEEELGYLEVHTAQTKANFTPEYMIELQGPVLAIDETGWRTYASGMRYFATSEQVEKEPERGISLEMAVIVFDHKDIDSEECEINEAGQSINVYLGMCVMQDFVESLKPADGVAVPAPEGAQ